VILTTKRSALFKALAVLGLPRVFLVTLDMMYTYLQLLVKSFEEMHLALKGRLARPFSRKESRRWIASRMSALYLRSYTMSREVYAAMVARGYTGEPKSLNGKERA
jgi:cobalt/nickel transport system permease protein